MSQYYITYLYKVLYIDGNKYTKTQHSKCVNIQLFSKLHSKMSTIFFILT